MDAEQTWLPKVPAQVCKVGLGIDAGVTSAQTIIGIHGQNSGICFRPVAPPSQQDPACLDRQQKVHDFWTESRAGR